MVDENEQQTSAAASTDESGAESGAPAAAPRRRRRAASRPAGPPVVVEGAQDAAEQGELFRSAAQAGASAAGVLDTADEAAGAETADAVSEQAPVVEPLEDETDGAIDDESDESAQFEAAAMGGDEADAPAGAPASIDPEPAAAPVARRSRRATRGVTTVAFSAVPEAEAEPAPMAAITAPAEVPAIAAVFQAPDETKAVRRRRGRDAQARTEADSESGTLAAVDEATDGAEPESADATDGASQPKRTNRSRRSRGPRAAEAQSAEGAEVEAIEGQAGGDSAADADRSGGEEASAAEDADRAESATIDDDTDESDESDESAEGLDSDREEDGAPRRRRRRGGRRRRRPGTGGSDDAEGTDASGAEGSDDDGADDQGQSTGQSADEADDSDADADEGESPSARRRRRRRRKAGVAEEMEDLSSEDPPNTVVKVREGRRPSDEITSLRGSTRIEAKKQRRRDGREAGRRRAPILTEAEFLARRESVNRVMCVREHGDRTQIAVLEDGILVEHYVNRAESSSMVGNVYLGKVQNVLPSMEAAFVDIGRGRNAVLYAGEVNWDAAGLEGQPKRIELALKSGDPVLVQVTKDPIGHKGARLTSQISLPGRFLVYVPEGSMTGISRKLPDTERSRLKAILREVVPAGAGVIVRTAAEGASEEQLTSDVNRLSAQWTDIQKKTKSASAPALLYGEPDLAIKVVRDIFNEDFTSLLVQGDTTWATLSEYIGWVAPDLQPKMAKWVEPNELFAAHRIDEQLAKALDRKVWLPSGGSLVIDRTEAMTVVDVNTGKFTGQGGNLEETVTKNNLEAAEEIVRQLRLRDIGGIIVVDFIDMVLESNRDLVLRRLVECLGRDRTKHQVAEVTSLGLVQMTRKRIGQGLLEVFSTQCEHCGGRGHLVSTEPVGSAEAPAEEATGGNRRERGGRRGNGNGNGNGGGGRQQSQAVLGGRQTGKTPPPPKFDEHGHIDHSDEEHSEDSHTGDSHTDAGQPDLAPDQAAVILAEAVAEGIVELPEGSEGEPARADDDAVTAADADSAVPDDAVAADDAVADDAVEESTDGAGADEPAPDPTADDVTMVAEEEADQSTAV